MDTLKTSVVLLTTLTVVLFISNYIIGVKQDTIERLENEIATLKNTKQIVLFDQNNTTQQKIAIELIKSIDTNDTEDWI